MPPACLCCCCCLIPAWCIWMQRGTAHCSRSAEKSQDRLSLSFCRWTGAFLHSTPMRTRAQTIQRSLYVPTFLASLCRLSTSAAARRQAFHRSGTMSTNAHDIDPHSQKERRDAGNTWQQGSLTRFLSQQYRLPFAPLTRELSFEDVSTWPDDPMQVFSHWYADSEVAYNRISPERMDAPVHWPNTMQIATVSSSGFPSVRTVLLKGFDPRGLIFFTNYDGGKGSALTADSRVAVNFYWKTLERQVRFEGIAERLTAAESDAYFHERPIQSQIGGTVSPQSRPIAGHVELERAYVATVEGVAKQVKEHMEKAAASGEDAADLAATKQRVSKLLGAMSLQASADAIAAKGDAAAAAACSTPVSPADAAATHAAHAAALSSLQKLDSVPSTRSVLHALVPRPAYWGGYLIRPLQAEFWCDGAYRLHSRIVYKDADRTPDTRKANGKTTADTRWIKTFLAP